MDPVTNPFAPGAGSRPPALVGREDLEQAATVALKRIKAGRHAKSAMLLGLRGVGKTVLLVRVSEIAESEGYLTSLLEAPEDRRLAGLLVPRLRALLYKFSGVEKARILSNRALGALRNFASAFRVSYGDLEVGVGATAGTRSLRRSGGRPSRTFDAGWPGAEALPEAAWPFYLMRSSTLGNATSVR